MQRDGVLLVGYQASCGDFRLRAVETPKHPRVSARERVTNMAIEMNEADIKWLKDAGYGNYVPGEHKSWMDKGQKVPIDVFAMIIGAIAEKLTYKSLKAGAVDADLQQLERMWAARFVRGTPFHAIGSHVGGTVSNLVKEAGFQKPEQLNNWINTKAAALKNDVQARIKNAVG